MARERRSCSSIYPDARVLLLLRSLKILFFALLTRRRDILEESRLSLCVWPNDCDLNFHLNDGRYVSIAGMGRIDLLTRTGLLRQAFKRGWFPVIGGTIVRYRHSLMPFERFTLVTRIAAWDEKWFYIEHRFERRDGSIAASSIVRGVLRDKKGSIPTADVLKIIDRAEAVSPPISEVISRWNDLAF
jgi:acyl-CoA thioesterase FadM